LSSREIVPAGDCRSGGRGAFILSPSQKLCLWGATSRGRQPTLWAGHQSDHFRATLTYRPFGALVELQQAVFDQQASISRLAGRYLPDGSENATVWHEWTMKANAACLKELLESMIGIRVRGGLRFVRGRPRARLVLPGVAGEITPEACCHAFATPL
jgi:hypothetical protein